MPKPPLIASPTKRHAVIAVVMGIVLAGCLLLTALVTGAPLFGDQPQAEAPPATGR